MAIEDRTDGYRSTELRPAYHSDMPDLSALHRNNMLSIALGSIVGRNQQQIYTGRVISQSFVRLIDKALEEYELSRVAFDEYVHRPDASLISPLFRAIGHMESCLTSLERSLRFLDRMYVDPSLSPVSLPSKTMTPEERRRLSTIRNATEHLDHRILKGTISQGDFIMLWMSPEGVVLQRTEIKYSELGRWLRALHALAEQISR